ncbi:MAG: hypothetical protein EOO03_04035 [Chitinophagaceae bacterium]|nr:MAG: hypothetical protein EOO03_04035 [Chitinophagaceae bacterium]
MAGILYKWFLGAVICLFFSGAAMHPIYVSVAEVEYNSKAKTLEVSCKLFTDDFEKALRAEYKTNVDLINPPNRAAMDKLVNDYVQKHFSITVNGRQVALKYLGFEEIEEGIYSYFEASNVQQPTTVHFYNNLLYAHHEQQMGLMHVKVNGHSKSTKLNNPETRATVSF